MVLFLSLLYIGLLGIVGVLIGRYLRAKFNIKPIKYEEKTSLHRFVPPFLIFVYLASGDFFERTSYLSWRTFTFVALLFGFSAFLYWKHHRHSNEYLIQLFYGLFFLVVLTLNLLFAFPSFIVSP
ncbi:DUF4181 domain-containing protein [Halalkalibacter wakoensis]|uniref:DUF4181 domain-containing protein n=1 Tax=Halalkalibacter wakoensis TaxID=127891 RepID=UPI00054D6ABC|nr:DUF4181 domain-containing protein [Halalkalibacter wakoensis]